MNLDPTLPSDALAAASPTGQAPVADATLDPAYRKKAGEAAQKFEGFLIGQMLHQMRNSMRELADEDSPFKDKVNSDMLDYADTLVADAMASQRAFGVADAILRQLLPESPAQVPASSQAGRFKSTAAPVALDQQPIPHVPAP